MASDFESWVRTTVSQMPFFDAQKGGFIGVPVLKKTLLASIPQQILDSTKAANPAVNLAAELNTIFKQGGLTQELLAECERRRQVTQAEKDAKEEESPLPQPDQQPIAEASRKQPRSGKPEAVNVPQVPATGGVPVELPSNANGKEEARDTKADAAARSETPVKNIVKETEIPPMPKPEEKTKVTEKIVRASDEEPARERKKEMRLESSSRAPSSNSSRSPQSPTSPSHLNLEPGTPTTLIHTPPFLLGAPQVPFIVQHRLLNHLQAMLEESCYHYMAREYPEILREKEWDCPEAAELTVWVHTITKVLATSNDIAENDVVEISSTLRRAGKVRHCAVHRKAVSTVQLWILLDNAEAALRFLGDGRREKEVLNLRRLVESESRELGLKLEKGEQQLSDELEELDRLREELARREAAARTRQEELEARAKSDMATNLAGLLDHAINKKEPVEISSNNAARVGTARTTAPDTRQTTPSKKTRHTESVEEFRKLGLKPLRPPPSSTCQFNLTKLAASARQASLQKRSPTPQEVSCDGGKVTESQFFDASETLARKAVLEDDPGYSSEEGGTQLHS